MKGKDEKRRGHAKSGLTALWNKWKSKNASEKVKALIQATVASALTVGVGLGTVGYIKASDAQSTIKQNESAWLQDLQGAQEKAEAAQATADEAQATATAAEETSTAAQSVADKASTDAASAKKAADELKVAAEEAQAKADAAKVEAEKAWITADKTQAVAAQAQLKADEVARDVASTNEAVTAAQQKANDAQGKADEAAAFATATQGTASAAQNAASDAATAAAVAQSTADAARTAANTAQESANEALEIAKQAVLDAAAAQNTADAAQAAADAAQSTANAAIAGLPRTYSALLTENQNASLTSPSGANVPIFGTPTFDGTSKYIFSYSWLRKGFNTSCTGGIVVNDNGLKTVDTKGKPYPIITPGTPIDDYTSFNYVTRAAIVTPPAGAHNVYLTINPDGTCQYSDLTLTITKVG